MQHRQRPAHARENSSKAHFRHESDERAAGTVDSLCLPVDRMDYQALARLKNRSQAGSQSATLESLCRGKAHDVLLPLSRWDLQ